MRKAIALILSVLLAMSVLFGCGGDSESTTTPEQKTDTKAADTKEAGDDDTAEAETSDVITDFEGTTVVMAMWATNPDQAGVDRVRQKVVDYFSENYNIDLDLQFMTGTEYSNITMMLAAGEQVDVFSSGQIGFSSLVASESLYDLYENDLIYKYGQDIIDMVEPVMLSANEVNGHLYGVTNTRDYAIGQYCVVFAKSFLDGINYDYGDNDVREEIHISFEEFDDLLARLHEAYPDVTVIYPWGQIFLQQKLPYDPVGGDTFGVLLDSANSLKLDKLYTSDMFIEYANWMYKWQQAGYISPDALTDTEYCGNKIKAGTLMADYTGGKPGITLQKETERGGIESVSFTLGDNFIPSARATEASWSLNANTECPEAALTVLNQFYCNSYIANLLVWGEENVDYIVNDDGQREFPEGVTTDNAEYYKLMPQYAVPCEYMTLVSSEDPADLWSQTKEFNESAIWSLAMGFSWNNTDYSGEYTALTNVWLEYADSILFGLVKIDDVVEELDQRMEDAGLSTYMDAKQEALNAWAIQKGLDEYIPQ